MWYGRWQFEAEMLKYGLLKFDIRKDGRLHKKAQPQARQQRGANHERG